MKVSHYENSSLAVVKYPAVVKMSAIMMLSAAVLLSAAVMLSFCEDPVISSFYHQLPSRRDLVLVYYYITVATAELLSGEWNLENQEAPGRR